MDVEQSVVAQKALGVGFVEGPLQNGDKLAVFMAEVDEPFLGPDGDRPADHPLQHGVGAAADQLAVDRSVRVRFVGQADDVFPAGRDAHRRPPGQVDRVAGPVPGSDVGVAHDLNNVSSAQGGDFDGGLVAAESAIGGQIVGRKIQ